VSNHPAPPPERPQAIRARVLVPYGYRSIPVLQLAAAARGICQPIWLVHGSDPEAAAMAHLLRRVGPIVDIEGLDPDATAATVAPYRPDGVVAFRDQDLAPMAELAARLDLDFHDPDVAGCLADKVEQRRALSEGGLPVPRWWVAPAERDPAMVADLVTRVVYPVVVKPRQGSGSRHTFLAENPAELAALLSEETTKVRGAGQEAAEAMIVEEWLASRRGADKAAFADYVSVETLFSSQGLHHVAVTGRTHLAAPFRETGFFIPSDLGSPTVDQVLATATEALQALKVRSGCVHTEVKITPEGPRVIEVNGRMGGGIREVLQAGGGPDLLALHLRAALGEAVNLTGLAAGERVGFRLFHQPPISARRVIRIGSLEAIRSLSGVDDVSVHLEPGDPLNAEEGSRTFVFSVVGSARDHAEVATINRLIYELAEVDYELVDTDVEPVGPR